METVAERSEAFKAAVKTVRDASDTVRFQRAVRRLERSHAHDQETMMLRLASVSAETAPPSPRLVPTPRTLSRIRAEAEHGDDPNPPGGAAGATPAAVGTTSVHRRAAPVPPEIGIVIGSILSRYPYAVTDREQVEEHLVRLVGSGPWQMKMQAILMAVRLQMTSSPMIGAIAVCVCVCVCVPCVCVCARARVAVIHFRWRRARA